MDSLKTTRFKIMKYLSAIVLIAGLVSLVSSPLLALESSVFTIRDIKVDVVADSAAQAREKAINQAQKEAFDRLTRRILRFEDASILPEPGKSTLRRLIQDFEIRDERLSSVRYKANFIFRFKQDAVREYFDAQGLSYTDVGSKPVLVLPFYQTAEEILLWDDKNLWMEAWSLVEGNQGLVPVAIPIGDLQDVSAIQGDEALGFDRMALQDLTRRYNAGEAIILIAAQPRVRIDEITANDQANSPLSIFIYRTDKPEPEFVTRLTLSPEQEETRLEMFQRGVTKVFRLLQRNWKEQTIVDPDEQNSLRVSVEYVSLDDWVRIKNSLSEVQGLLDIRYLSISPFSATVQLFFRGSEKRLRLALAQEDMTLSKPKMNMSALLSDENRLDETTLLYSLSLNN